MKKIQYLILSALLFTIGCGTKVQTTYELNDIEFKKDGPFMAESSETFDNGISEAFEKLMKLKQIDVKTIASVKLKSAVFTTADSQMFNDFKSVSLSIMGGGDAKTQQLGAINPIKKDANKLELQNPAQSELAELFKSNEINVVCDLNPAADREKAFAFKGNFSFVVELKK